MPDSISRQAQLHPESREFYCEALSLLNRAGVPFMIGGAFAFERYTGIVRDTKDIDVFAHPDQIQQILDVFAEAGYQTEYAVSHWLAKARRGEYFVDFIFNSAHGQLPVSNLWFEHAIEEEVLDIPVLICAPEEMIWSKSFVMARDRYDGADIAHLILACGQTLDWSRLLRQFGPHWRVLFSHLVLFGFIYPGKRSHIPAWVMETLSQRLLQETGPADVADNFCQGPMLAPLQYLPDIEDWGYEDARLRPHGSLNADNVAEWTEHLHEEHA
ncbi:nucleotidyltransferase [Pseudanabaena sp. FACHB-2040]|uniref:nucleotidyltransferase n=1 Tax=Pseudanabaena sp. FACHB-2040 TaxID=2692859 RepID=UPI0016853E4D|nr:nucleotidyltransferase [Pseudanabaena sp. FACHB-2040]MBD2256207.1 nucleotidyltransferase [Pseudanabaena sp. FACHB-2040]